MVCLLRRIWYFGLLCRYFVWVFFTYTKISIICTRLYICWYVDADTKCHRIYRRLNMVIRLFVVDSDVSVYFSRCIFFCAVVSYAIFMSSSLAHLYEPSVEFSCMVLISTSSQVRNKQISALLQIFRNCVRPSWVHSQNAIDVSPRVFLQLHVNASCNPAVLYVL